MIIIDRKTFIGQGTGVSMGLGYILKLLFSETITKLLVNQQLLELDRKIIKYLLIIISHRFLVTTKLITI